MFAILAWTFPVWVLAPCAAHRRGRWGRGSRPCWPGGRGRIRWPRVVAAAARLRGVPGGRGSGAVRLRGRHAAPAGPGSKSDREDDPRPLLWAWVLGVAAIVIPFAPFVAVRSFLPIQPPLAPCSCISAPPRRGRLVAAVGLSAVLGCGAGGGRLPLGGMLSRRRRADRGRVGRRAAGRSCFWATGAGSTMPNARASSLGRPLARSAGRGDRDHPPAGRPPVDPSRGGAPSPDPPADRRSPGPFGADDLEPRRWESDSTGAITVSSPGGSRSEPTERFLIGDWTRCPGGFCRMSVDCGS